MTIIILNSIYTKEKVEKKNIRPLSIIMAVLYIGFVIWVLVS